MIKLEKTESVMEAKDYIIVKIDGDYAYLREVGNSTEEDLFIALALLPAGADIGMKLHYENFEFSID